LRLLSAGLLGCRAGSVDLFLPAEALFAARGTMLLAEVFTILVGRRTRGIQRVPVHGFKPKESVVFLPAIVAACFTDFLEMLPAEDSICDLDSGAGRGGHGYADVMDIIKSTPTLKGGCGSG